VPHDPCFFCRWAVSVQYKNWTAKRQESLPHEMGAAKTHGKEPRRLRPKGQIKMGYYPTPDSVVALVKPRLVFPDGSFAALDPCCGTGKALAGLVAGTRAATYGVELDLERAREADAVLTTVAKGAFELS
jgi:hypothetical protein